MSNYDMDEIERNQKHQEYTYEEMREREKRSRGIKSENEWPQSGPGLNWPQSIELGKDEMPHTAIDVEIPDKDFIKLAHAAHTRDITVNKMVNILLKSSMKDLDYRYEHNNKPQLLNEDN
jgi:hypothetical protein